MIQIRHIKNNMFTINFNCDCNYSLDAIREVEVEVLKSNISSTVVVIIDGEPVQYDSEADVVLNLYLTFEEARLGLVKFIEQAYSKTH